MGKVIDLTGNTYGRLTVLGLDHVEKVKNGSVVYWRCRCSCENQTIVTVRTGNLKSGHTQSCGCFQKERAVDAVTEANTKHGMTGKPIHKTWKHINQRCTNPNNPQYPSYGGRGIKVCERWLKFENFYEDVSKLPHFGEKGYTLDRIDNNKGYEPSNVRFATPKEQARNRRSNAIVEYEGEQMTLAEAAELSGINYYTLCSRYKRGLRGDELFAPVKGSEATLQQLN